MAADPRMRVLAVFPGCRRDFGAGRKPQHRDIQRTNCLSPVPLQLLQGRAWVAPQGECPVGVLFFNSLDWCFLNTNLFQKLSGPELSVDAQLCNSAVYGDIQ